jgi:hypothetical protein
VFLIGAFVFAPHRSKLNSCSKDERNATQPKPNQGANAGNQKEKTAENQRSAHCIESGHILYQ